MTQPVPKPDDHGPAAPALSARRQRRRALPLAAALAGALALGGCMLNVNHQAGEHGDRALGGKPDPSNPRVLVTHGRLSVDQEPLRFYKAQGKVKITWRLPNQGPYTFPTDGIVIEPAERTKTPPVKEEFVCARDPNPRHFSCENRNSAPGRYKYTVKVLDNDQPLEPLDPVIVNQW